MLLSEILDPRRYAAEKAAAAARADEGACAEDQAARWAAEDAAALESALADLAELRGLAMGLARAVAAEAAAALAAVTDAGDEPEGHMPPRSGRCARDTAPAGGGGAETRGAIARAAQVALDRLGRTVRLTAALEKRLRAERARGLAEAGAQEAARGRAAGPVKIDHPLLSPEERAALNARLVRMVLRKQTIVGVVQEALEADGRDEETIEDVGEVVGRRLLDWDASDTFNLPIGRMAARYLRQMKIGPVDWSRFADRDWAVEEAATKAPGSPFGSPDIPPMGWRGGVAEPHPDSVEMAAERAAGAAPPGSSP